MWESRLLAVADCVRGRDRLDELVECMLLHAKLKTSKPLRSDRLVKVHSVQLTCDQQSDKEELIWKY